MQVSENKDSCCCWRDISDETGAALEEGAGNSCGHARSACADDRRGK